MPYNSIEEAKKAGFPTNAEGIALTLSQVNDLAKIYDAIKAAGSAENPMAVAWVTWKKKYKKEGDAWVKAKSFGQMETKHTAILQTLNRRTKEGYCFPSNIFNEKSGQWVHVPIVYAGSHPDLHQFNENPDHALTQVNGEIVGHVNSAWVDYTGHPKFMAELSIYNPGIEAKIKEGKISLSTAFFGASDSEKNVVSFTPNHVLLFDETSENMPKDLGSMILNQTNYHNEFDEKIIGFCNNGELVGNEPFFRSLLNDIKTIVNSTITEQNKRKEGIKTQEPTMTKEENTEFLQKIEDYTKEIAILNQGLKAKDDTISALTAEKDVLSKELIEIKNKIEADEAERIKATREAQWTQIKNSLPIGLTKEPDKEKELRKAWESDPFGFSAKMPEMVIEHTNKRTIEGAEEPEGTDGDAATVRELLMKSGRRV